MKVIKRDKQVVDFQPEKIRKAIESCFSNINTVHTPYEVEEMVLNELYIQEGLFIQDHEEDEYVINVEDIQDLVEKALMSLDEYAAAKHFILYREKHKTIRDYVQNKIDFISKYKQASNTADATVDDNSNVGTRNIAVINAEAHKQDNIQISRGMIMHKLKELYPDFLEKQYIKDLESHIIYKHDESTFSGAIAPYCVSISMYPFLTNGIEGIGGLSAAPKNIDSFCGMYINLIFAVAAQYAGAVATSEFLLYFDYFARKEWGDDYYLKPEMIIKLSSSGGGKSILKQIHQYWQQVIYSINQPAAARGMQSAFVNFSYFDKPFFEAMFDNFYFPDGTKPVWESLSWLQKEFMQWFNNERLRCLLTFPVESFALIYKNGKFEDEETAKFVAEEYARGHSFFTYISDTADSLSSCCFDKNTRIMYSTSNSKNFVKSVEIGKAYNDHKDDIIEVLGYNPYTNVREWVKGKFVKYKCSELYKITFNNRADWTTIIATHDHIFPISKDGIYVDTYTADLKVGDKLLADKAQWNLSLDDEKEVIEVEIASIEKITKEQDAYCVELLDKNSPYFVLSNGIITHNCRLKNKVQTKEFNFTNGNLGVNLFGPYVLNYLIR